MSDPVNHPAHYGGEDDPYEVIKVIEAWGLDFALGNVLKYVRRAHVGKPGADRCQDLAKAVWYLLHALEKAGKHARIDADASGTSARRSGPLALRAR